MMSSWSQTLLLEQSPFCLADFLDDRQNLWTELGSVVETTGAVADEPLQCVSKVWHKTSSEVLQLCLKMVDNILYQTVAACSWYLWPVKCVLHLWTGTQHCNSSLVQKVALILACKLMNLSIYQQLEESLLELKFTAESGLQLTDLLLDYQWQDILLWSRQDSVTQENL